jgi:hypothetical protein
MGLAMSVPALLTSTASRVASFYERKSFCASSPGTRIQQ